MNSNEFAIHLRMIYKGFTNPNFLLNAPIQSSLIQFTNVIFTLLSPQFVYQSFFNQPHPFHYIAHIVANVNNYSNL